MTTEPVPFIDGQNPPRFRYRTPPALRAGRERPERRHPVIVIGAGPVGLAAALDLARRGIAVIVLDDDDRVSVGSRAICWSRRTLDYLDRLGVAPAMMAKGVTWETGRLFHRDRELYQFAVSSDSARKHPAFLNLQQYYVEAIMVRRLQAQPLADLRWRNQVRDIGAGADGVTVTVRCPDGDYRLEADYVIAADGARSTVRSALGLDFEGRVFRDQFLIADVEMQANFPEERWFWFDPPFNPGQSALLHMQADNIWRIDLQLGPDADADAARAPAEVDRSIRRMLGPESRFETVWVSVYTFQCRRLRRFRHGRILFAGDAAHQVSPFGARGGNGGLQDIDNLVWKLAAVLDGRAPRELLDSYDAERIPAADENILNSTRSTDFITPKSDASRALRDSVLALADHWPFARALVNSGRLSTAFHYRDSPLIDAAPAEAHSLVGASCPNLAIAGGGQNGYGWLHDRLSRDFTLLGFRPLAGHKGVATVTVDDPDLPARFGIGPEGAVLLRPDHHISAIWPAPPAADTVERVLARSLAAPAPVAVS